MNALMFELQRLKIFVRSERPLDKCWVCGAPLKISAEDVLGMLGDRARRFKATAKYYEVLEEMTAKVLKREINLEGLGKYQRRLTALMGEADFVVGFGSHMAAIYCEKCQTRIPISIDVGIDDKINARYTFDNVLELEATKELDFFFRRVTGRTWSELRMEAKDDPRRKAEIRELLKEAGVFF
ncbi:MAG: hypothetical protein QXO75_01470 [Nitrososphaerota archaeon]